MGTAGSHRAAAARALRHDRRQVVHGHHRDAAGRRDDSATARRLSAPPPSGFTARASAFPSWSLCATTAATAAIRTARSWRGRAAASSASTSAAREGWCCSTRRCTALSLALTLAMGLSAALPPNRGDLTVAEFAENVNFYRGFFDCGERWSLDKTASGRERV